MSILDTFYRALHLLTTLPPQPEDSDEPNMVSVDLSDKGDFAPEMIQIIQEADGRYFFQHLERDTHRTLDSYHVDPHKFVYNNIDQLPVSVVLCQGAEVILDE
jgi:hypothetical protein